MNDFSFIYSQHATVLYQEGNYGAAIEYYTCAIEAAGYCDPALYHNRALAYAALAGQYSYLAIDYYSAAYNDMDNAAKLDPKFPLNFFYRAEFNLAKNSPKDSANAPNILLAVMNDYYTAAQLDPTNQHYVYMVERTRALYEKLQSAISVPTTPEANVLVASPQLDASTSSTDESTATVSSKRRSDSRKPSIAAARDAMFFTIKKSRQEAKQAPVSFVHYSPVRATA